MPKIKALSSDLISKIAAGEVIERPAFALKELVENSIDAHATSIKIELDKAGLQKISITDNGEGMDKEDIRECYKPHTTSKIHTEADLFAVHSMGFRGEALASMASISTMIVRSKTKEAEIGTEIQLQFGELEKMSPFGMPHGTQIVIENIFNNVPARRKFLTNTAAEFKLILELITALAIAHPEIGFTLIHNQKTIFDVAKNQTLLQRISSINGLSWQEHLIEINTEDSYLTLRGYIAKPQLSTQTATKQFLFVNNRKVVDKHIAAKIKDSYGTLLEPKVQPIFVLFIDLPYERVDVNVHPRKEQVAFLEPDTIINLVNTAVVAALSEQNLIYNDRRWQKGEYAPVAYEQWSVREGGTATYAGALLKNTITPWTVEADPLQKFDIIQMHNLYLVTQTVNGFIIIDQHAAHERILFEQYVDAFLEQKGTAQSKTISPLSLELSPLEVHTLTEHSTELKSLGFGWNTEPNELTAVPELFIDRDHQQLIKELLEDLIENHSVKEIDAQSHKLLAYLACRNAIKAGDRINKQQAENLIEKLKLCRAPFTCPHGRPTQIEMSLGELHHKFHRK